MSGRLNITKTCQQCGKSFRPWRKESKYCSQECSAKSQKTLDRRECERCGDLFEPYSESTKYCSRECYFAEPSPKKDRVTLVCEVCGDEYECKQYRADSSRFCSEECWANRAEPISHTCKNCGNTFTHHSEARTYCSRHCAQEHMTGENAPRWKGGVSLDNERARNSGKLRKWRKKVFKRDNYTCQECGASGVKLHAHHIKSFADHPGLRYEVSNGKTLCIDCHGDKHGKDFRKSESSTCPHCGAETSGRGKNGRCRSCAIKHSWEDRKSD